MKEARFEYRIESDHKVRIIPTMGKIPNIEQYINLAKDILTREIENNEDRNLLDLESRDILDSIQLMYEFKQKFNNRIKSVVFSYKSKDIEVTNNNIDNISSIIRAIDDEEQHLIAIREAVIEGLERID